MCVTTEILLEYEEILSRDMGKETTDSLLQVLRNAPNTELITAYFRWNMITTDEDDNKFVDCAIAANADFLVTNDKHFDALKKQDLFEIKVLTALQFIKKLSGE